MDTIPLSAYIAAGSFVVPLDGTDVSAPDTWLLSQTDEQPPVSDSGENSTLPNETKLLLLKLPEFAAVVRPLLHRWIRLAFCRASVSETHSSPPSLGICRIYVLPDDAYRRLVPRSDVKVRRDLQRLLNGLDYSPELWNDRYVAKPSVLVHDARVRKGDDSDEGDTSLLQMFNTIPSPQPRVDLVRDESYQRVLDALMTSRVAGLKATTTLYGHQIRSAAVMLQRELQPGRVVDPRLLCLREQATERRDERSERSKGDAAQHVDNERGEDQKESERSEEKNEQSEDTSDGRTWYYDDVTGEVLRTARLYDGVSGGILAEEMGTGKTLICLALILATRAFPAELPDVYAEREADRTSDASEGGRRHGPRSLADMAGTVVARQSVPWKLYLADTAANANEFRHCIAAIQRNPAVYVLPRFKATARDSPRTSSASRSSLPSPFSGGAITLSSCSLVLVPANLVRQWEEEIAKHTEGLNVLVVAGQRAPIPTTAQILEADILLFSIPRFEKLAQDREVTRAGYELRSPLATVHFKRVIVDEGHRLGNSKMGRKSNLLLVLDCLQVSARWIVTGTPSTGLFGVEEQSAPEVGDGEPLTPSTPSTPGTTAALQERKDLERIGAMASLYLRVRPWANTVREVGSSGSILSSSSGAGDAPADWAVYVMQPHHSSRSSGGRRDGLRATLDSLIIRHRTAEVGDLLPTVDERVVVLDGSHQDRLCLNLFSMMIVFNAVQSQRTDQDYFFHPRQRGALLRLLSNIRQATFFGANFYSAAEISTALETAEKFLEDKKVPVSDADEHLLRRAIAFGHVAAVNRFKRLADACHEVPIYVADMPGGGAFAAAWSIDGEQSKDGLTCTAAPMVRALQQYLRPCMDAPTSLRAMFDDGRFAQKGHDVLQKQQEQVQKQTPRANGNAAGSAAGGNSGSSSTTPSKGDPTLAGNTKLGEDNHAGSLKRRITLDAAAVDASAADVFLAAPLANTRLVSTASAKLSYLLDAIVRHQADEQIIVFYDNENVAFYLAEHLEILQIQHLIYARGITAERRAQYVATFNGDVPSSTTKPTQSTEGITDSAASTTASVSAAALPSTTSSSSSSSPAASASSPFRVLLMDLSQAAFGLDMRSASRVYFTSPVLNPQVEAQAVGRVRRISQGAARGGEKRVLHVETLVLRDSLEEVIVDRRQALTPAEHRRIKTLLDDGPIYEWVRNASVVPMGGDGGTEKDGPGQMAPLKTPQFLFGRGFGRVVHPDEGLVVVERPAGSDNREGMALNGNENGNGNGNGVIAHTDGDTTNGNTTPTVAHTDEPHPPKKRKLLPRAPVRFA